MSKALLRWLVAALLRTLKRTARLLPLGVCQWLGRRLGDLVRLLQGRRYRVALENLRIAYGDALTEAERRRIARESFRSFGMLVMEGLKLPQMPPSQLLRRIEWDEDEMTAMMRAIPSEIGLLAITGHIGNFEAPAPLVLQHGRRIVALTRATRDQATWRIIQDLHQRLGVELVALGRSMKPVFTALRSGAAVIILCDQNAGDVTVPFFGQPTGTADGPAKLALRTGAPLLCFACIRLPGGRFRLRFCNPLDTSRTDDEAADVRRIMTEVNRQLELFIREAPEQWLWFHDRWRASPGVKRADAPAPAGHESP